jgi:DNA-directed RNA polymerase subunit RPC12/RpoP
MPLACKECGKAFKPVQAESFIAAYQPDMQITCPECHAVLKCKSCGFVYGEPDSDELE